MYLVNGNKSSTYLYDRRRFVFRARGEIIITMLLLQTRLFAATDSRYDIVAVTVIIIIVIPTTTCGPHAYTIIFGRVCARFNPRGNKKRISTCSYTLLRRRYL